MRLGFLRHLYDNSTNACASVYLDTLRAGETSAGEVELRWRAAREKLADGGADAATLDALADLVTDPGHAAPGLPACARAGRVLLDRPMAGPPLREIARFSPLPHVMPMLAQAAPEVPHLRVTADRSGGELVEVFGKQHGGSQHGGPQHGGSQHGGMQRVQGDGWPVHKPSGGGWSQGRYQRSAEEAWASNEKEFAAAVTAAAERTGAEL